MQKNYEFIKKSSLTAKFKGENIMTKFTTTKPTTKYGIIQSAIFNLPVSPQAKSLYCYLASIAGSKEYAHPKIQTMEKAFGVTRNTIYTWSEELVKAGAIIKGKLFPKWLCNINKYTVYYIDESKTVADTSESNGENTIEVSPSGHYNNNNSININNNNSDNFFLKKTKDNKTIDSFNKNATNTECISGNTSISLNAKNKLFEIFTNSYPSFNTDKLLIKKAEKKYLSLVSTQNTGNSINEATKNYKDETIRNGTQEKYLKHPNNWLNEWEKYYISIGEEEINKFCDYYMADDNMRLKYYNHDEAFVLEYTNKQKSLAFYKTYCSQAFVLNTYFNDKTTLENIFRIFKNTIGTNEEKFNALMVLLERNVNNDALFVLNEFNSITKAMDYGENPKN